MRIIEIVHDRDHPDSTNIDLWARERGHCTEKFFVYTGQDFPVLKSYDLLLLHGGAQHLWEKDADPWLYSEIAYVKAALESGKPVLGICLGSQVIAEALGANVYRAAEKEAGWLPVSMTPAGRTHLLLKGIADEFVSFHWHSDHFPLPQTCFSLAYTEHAPNQIFYSTRVPAVGFQFHPEYTKDIVRYYADIWYEDIWLGSKYIPDKESFLAALHYQPETYGLFQALMDNTVSWFNIGSL